MIKHHGNWVAKTSIISAWLFFYSSFFHCRTQSIDPAHHAWECASIMCHVPVSATGENRKLLLALFLPCLCQKVCNRRMATLVVFDCSFGFLHSHTVSCVSLAAVKKSQSDDSIPSGSHSLSSILQTAKLLPGAPQQPVSSSAQLFKVRKRRKERHMNSTFTCLVNYWAMMRNCSKVA